MGTLNDLTSKFDHKAAKSVTMRYPVRFDTNRAVWHNESNVIAVQGDDFEKTKVVHFCLLMNPPPNSHAREEEINPDETEVLELLFSTHTPNDDPKRELPIKGVPLDIDGFAFITNTHSRQTPAKPDTIKASPSEKDLSTDRTDGTTSFLNIAGYGLNITGGGDISIIGKNSSMNLEDRITMTAPVSSNELKGNILTTQNFLTEYCMIPQNVLPTWIVGMDPMINVLEILEAYNEVNKWVQITDGLMDVYEAFGDQLA
jgi:hypothetical protein